MYTYFYLQSYRIFSAAYSVAVQIEIYIITKPLVATFPNVLHLLVNFYIFIPDFIAFFICILQTHHLTSHLAKQTVVVFNVFNVYSVALQTEIYITTPASLLSSTVKLGEYSLYVITKPYRLWHPCHFYIFGTLNDCISLKQALF